MVRGIVELLALAQQCDMFLEAVPVIFLALVEWRDFRWKRFEIDLFALGHSKVLGMYFH